MHSRNARNKLLMPGHSRKHHMHAPMDPTYIPSWHVGRTSPTTNLRLARAWGRSDRTRPPWPHTCARQQYKLTRPCHLRLPVLAN